MPQPETLPADFKFEDTPDQLPADFSFGSEPLKKKEVSQPSGQDSNIGTSKTSQSSYNLDLSLPSVKPNPNNTALPGLGKPLNAKDNILGKGTSVTETPKKTVKENPYFVDVTDKSKDNTATQADKNANIQSDIDTGKLDEKNVTTYRGASKLFNEKAIEVTGKNDTQSLIDYGKVAGVDDDLISRLDDGDKTLFQNQEQLKNLYEQRDILSKSDEQTQKSHLTEINKSIAEIEKNNAALYTKRNSDIDAQILDLQKQLNSGVKSVNVSTGSGSTYGAENMDMAPVVTQQQPLTDEDKTLLKSQISQLQKRKGAYLQDATNPKEVYQELSPKLKMYEDKNIIPKDASVIDKLKIYYGVKLTQLNELKKRSNAENDYNLGTFGNALVQSVKQRFVDDKTTKSINEIETELNSIAPIIAINADPNAKKKGFFKTFANSVVDNLTQTTNLNQTSQEKALAVSNAMQKVGVELSKERTEELNTQIQNKDFGQRKEKNADMLGSTTAFMVDFGVTYLIGEGILSGATKLAKLALSPKAVAALNVGKTALEETKIGRLAINVAEEGLKYEIVGDINKVIEKDATFSQGASGAIGSKIGEKTAEKLAMFLGKSASPFVKLVFDTLGRTGVELFEETAQNTDQLISEITGKDNFVSGAIELFKDSTKGKQFTDSIKQQYGNIDDDVDFVLQIAAMSTAFNVGKFGSYFKDLALQKRNELSETEKEQYDVIVHDMQGEVKDATEKTVSEISDAEKKTPEEIAKTLVTGNIANNESIDDIKKNKELDNKEIDDKIANIDKNIPQWQQDQQKEKLEKQRTEQNDYYESKIKLLGQATAAESASTIAKVETDIANKISRGEDLSAEETDYYNTQKEDIDKLVSSETYKSSTDNEKSSIENAITGQVEDNSIGVQRNQSNGGAVEQRNATENVKENTQESQQQKGQPQVDLQKEIDEKKQIISELEANPNSPFHKLVNIDEVRKDITELESKLSSSQPQQNDKVESPVGAQTSTEANNKVDESNTQTETSTMEDKPKDVLSENEKQDIVKSLDKNEIKQFLKLKTPQERTQFLTDKKNSEYSKKYDASESEAEALTRITTGIKDLSASEQQAEIEKRANDHAAEYQKYLDKNPISEETKKLPRVAAFAQQTAKAMRNIIDNPEKWQSKKGKSFENGSRIDENGDVIPEQMYIDLKEKVKSLRKQNKLEEIAKINEAPKQYYADNFGNKNYDRFGLNSKGITKDGSTPTFENYKQSFLENIYGNDKKINQRSETQIQTDDRIIENSYNSRYKNEQNLQINTKLDNYEQSGKTTTEKQNTPNTERESVVQQDNSSGKNKAVEKRKGTSKRNRKIRNTEYLKALRHEISDAHDYVMKSFIGGTKVTPDFIRKLFTTQNRITKTGVDSSKGERRAKLQLIQRDGIDSIDQFAHNLWENQVQEFGFEKFDTEQLRDAIESVVTNYNTPREMVDDLNSRYKSDEELNQSQDDYNKYLELIDNINQYSDEDVDKAIEYWESLSEEDVAQLEIGSDVLLQQQIDEYLKENQNVSSVESAIKTTKSELSELENKLTKQKEQLSKNLKENQVDIFGQNKTQSLFDDKAGQQKLVDETKKEIESKRKELKTLVDDLQRLKDEENQYDIPFQIIGEKGAARLENAVVIMENLQVAKKMQEAGIDALKIKLATGWERGGDGKWKMEIEDFQFKNIDAVLAAMLSKENKTFLAKDLLKGTELEKIYDNYNDLKITFNADKQNINDTADYNRFTNTITIYTANFQENKSGQQLENIKRQTNNLAGVRRKVVHELQHFVQENEGFARGGSPRIFENKTFTKEEEFILKEYVDSDKNAKEFLKNPDVAGLIEDLDLTNLKEIILTSDKAEISAILKDVSNDRFEKYRRIAGEVEARNAEARSKLTMQERAQQLLSDTEEIDEKDKIYLSNEVSTGIQESRSDANKFKSIPKESFDKLINTLSKAFPNIKIFSDEKLLAEKLKKYNSSVDLKTPNGTIYGAKFPDGTIYINTENLNANTPIHEFGHVWEKAFPEDFERGKLMLRNSEQGRKLIEETRLNPAYKGYSQSQIESEALVAAIGNKGEQIFNSNPKLLEKFQTWLNDLFAKISDRIGKITGIKSLEFSPDTTFENFTKQVAGQLLSGKQLDASVKNSDKTELQFSPDELKSQVDALRKEDFTDNEIRDYLLEAGNTNEQIDQVLGKEVFGIKKATVPQDVIDEISIDKKSHKQIYEAGKDNVQSGAVDPRQLVQDVLSGDTLVLDANQVAALIYYRAQIDNKLKASTEKLKNEDGDYYQLKANHDVLLQELADYHEMAVRTAYNQSVAFSMRKMLIDNEYNAQAQIAKYKAVNNGNISVEKEQEFIKLADDYKAAADKIAELENKLSEYEAQQALNIIIEDKKKISPARTQRKQKAKNLIAEGLDELAEALGTRLMAEGNERPKLTKALTKIGKGLIETGVASIEDVYDKIIEKVKEKFGDKVNVEIYKNDVIADLKNIYTKATVKNDELNISNVLIKNLVQNGYNTVESLTKKLKEIISETTQDVTDRQIHDAITKYGKTTNQSKEEIDQQITKLKRIMLLTSKIEDARNKNRPKKTGFIRDEASPEEREMQKQLNELLKDIPLDSVDTEKLFKTALEKVKKRLQNQIEDLEQQIKTGKKEAQKKGIEYDEEANNLVKRRDELKKKLEEIYGATGTSYEQRVKTALRTVKAAISEYERRIQESDFKRKEQNKLTPTSELQQEKDALKKLKDQYLEMRKDSDEAENERIDRFKKSLNRTIEQYKRRIREKDFAPKTRKENPYDEEIGKLKQEQAKIKFQFEKEQELNKLENRSTSEKIKDVILGILNIPRILKTTIDLSAPFRQGIRLMAGHPIEFTRAFFKMHKLAFSKNAYDKFIADFISSDAYNVIKASGLSITDATGAQKAREEQFWNNIISNTLENKTLNKFTLGIPKFLDNYTFKASERGYSGFIDMMRINVFLDAMKVMERQGITFENNKQAYKELAAYVNAATGRGDTGRMGQRTMEVLNSVFFSPKFIKSMYDYVRSVAKATTGIGSELPAPVRKMIVKDFVAFVGTTTLLTALAQAAVKGLGDDEKDLETDGRSSDFMKIVAGKTRYEFWSGYQPMVRTIWQYITGESKSINSGEIKKVDGSIFGGRDRNDLIVDFFGNKLSPNASFIYKFNKGKDGAGNEFDAGKELKDMFIPMSINLFAEEIGNDEKLSKIVIDNFLNFYGVSVQNFYNDIKKDNTSSGNNKSEEKPESKKNRNKR